MEISGNRLAENIAKHLYTRALESSRHHGITTTLDMAALTLNEHALVVDMIVKGDARFAEKAMYDHIHES
ncbi:FCD domain-containing protein [Herbiconiux sp. CPCC 205763]|uniref:FCD domain-containing protein n=1 Tax=Herbiconiux aconitum TaxID=2970913 RepID=A0ABT2GN89_9MICO|nr:FCD domain-containing protein [Herbiconiux aconitum]MCS5717689.1 FCD domain-containing protein [Herbiconiux aconitum]